MMLEPLNTLKSLRGPTIGASIGMFVSGVVYLFTTHQDDNTFYAVVLLGGSAGAALHGILLSIGGPIARFCRFCERILEILVLRRLNLLTDKKKDKYLKDIYDERYSKDDDEPSPKKRLP